MLAFIEVYELDADLSPRLRGIKSHDQGQHHNYEDEQPLHSSTVSVPSLRALRAIMWREQQDIPSNMNAAVRISSRSVQQSTHRTGVSSIFISSVVVTATVPPSLPEQFAYHGEYASDEQGLDGYPPFPLHGLIFLNSHQMTVTVK